MRVKVTDFSGGIRDDKSDQLKTIGHAKTLLNFCVSDGSIKGLKTIEKNSLVSELLAGLNIAGGRIFCYKRYDFDLQSRDDKLIVFDSEFNGYYINLEDEEKSLVPLGVKFDSRPVMINYRLNGEDVLIMVSKTDNMVVWNGKDSPEIVLDAPKIKSMDIHYERLFAVTSGEDGSELKFSDDLDPTNWSESLSDAGSISFVDDRGRLVKVVSFCDYLYVFREFGITRVYANTSIQSNFYVNHLFVSGGRILGDTIAVTGDRIMFVATDGFYVFDGVNTRRVLENIFPKLNLVGNEEAAFFDGKYYLSCNIKSDDGSVTHSVLRIGVDDFSVVIIDGVDPVSMAEVVEEDKKSLFILDAVTSGVVCEVEGESLSPMPLRGVFESGFYDFSTTKQKTITAFRLVKTGSGVVTGRIESDTGEVFEVSSDNGFFDERLLVSGREFRLKISTDDPSVVIKSVELEVKPR